VSYGRLRDDQAEAVRQAVRGRKVIDCGAGDLGLSCAMAVMGAQEVIALDKDRMQTAVDARVRPVEGFFEGWVIDHPHDIIEVAFVSWPSNYSMGTFDRGLQAIIERAGKVIYLGKNTDGSMCGSQKLFKHLLRRELAVYLPSRPNTLCIYGRKLDAPRKGRHEELAIFDPENIWPYEEDAPHERRTAVRAQSL